MRAIAAVRVSAQIGARVKRTDDYLLQYFNRASPSYNVTFTLPFTNPSLFRALRARAQCGVSCCGGGDGAPELLERRVQHAPRAGHVDAHAMARLGRELVAGGDAQPRVPEQPPVQLCGRDAGARLRARGREGGLWAEAQGRLSRVGAPGWDRGWG